MTEAALALVIDPSAPDPSIIASEGRERAISMAYAKAYTDALAPGPRLAEMIDALDRAAQRMASGQRAAMAAYGAEINGAIVRDTVAINAACDVLAAVRQNVTTWPIAMQKVIARSMGDLATVTKR